MCIKSTLSALFLIFEPMLVKENTYKTDYKPRICIVKCTFFYIKNKDVEQYNRLKMANRHREKDKLVKELHIPEILATLDDENRIPTKKLKAALSKRIWRVYKIKGKLEDHNTNIMNIEVISEHGRVNYKFNALLH